jgi:NAD(P)-dependent dehydrogenase (short-subunit alcohol dehydrogenase family)
MQQSVFISGAAQGIGAEIARLFHNHGFDILPDLKDGDSYC